MSGDVRKHPIHQPTGLSEKMERPSVDGCGSNGRSLLFSVFRIRSMEPASERRSVAR